jgi:hypothetical protein
LAEKDSVVSKEEEVVPMETMSQREKPEGVFSWGFD